MQTIPIPVLADNLTYVIVDDGVAVVVDPGEAGPVLKTLQSSGLQLAEVILTHAHGDHTAGEAELRKVTGCRVTGPDECRGAGLDRIVGGGDRVSVAGMDFEVLHTPGHTTCHVCYYLAGARAVWTGDTLFVGGCGRIQKGNAEAMWRSLCRLRELPLDTAIHSGHDYTIDNIEFAMEILPGDPAVKRLKAHILELTASGKSVASSTVASEREANIFLRADTDIVRAALGMPGANPVAVFAELRRRKDNW